jgi:hypothetical protein
LVEADGSVHVPDNSFTTVVPHTKVVAGQHLAAFASLLVETGYSSKVLRDALTISIPVPIPVSEV